METNRRESADNENVKLEAKLKAEKKSSMDQITSLLNKIEQLEATHKTQIDELKSKSLAELKLSQVSFRVFR